MAKRQLQEQVTVFGGWDDLAKPGTHQSHHGFLVASPPPHYRQTENVRQPRQSRSRINYVPVAQNSRFPLMLRLGSSFCLRTETVECSIGVVVNDPLVSVGYASLTRGQR